MKQIFLFVIAIIIAPLSFSSTPGLSSIRDTDHSKISFPHLVSNTTNTSLMPTAAFFLNPALGCAVPHNVFFVDQSTNADQWLWDFGDGSTLSTDQNPSHTYTGIGAFTVTLTVTDSATGMMDSTTQTVTVSATNTDFTGSPVIGCGPLTVNFSDTSTASGATITSWSWDFGDGSTPSTNQNPSHTFDLPGTYNVTLTVTTNTNCMSSLTRNNYVQALGPLPEFSTPDPTAGNAPLTVNFVDETTYGAPAQSWLWEFGNGDISTLQNPTYTYASGCGNFDVTLTVTDINDCERTITKPDFIQLTDNALSITCPPMDTADANPDCEYIIPDYSGLAAVTGNCIPGMFSQDPPTGTTVGLGITIITVTVTDSVNTESCSFELEVVDTSIPVVTCPGNQIEAFDGSCQFTLPDYTSLVTVTDACETGLVVTQDPLPGTIISGQTTITFSSTDSIGNTGTCTIEVIPNDATPPMITCPPTQTEFGGEGCTFIIPDYTDQAVASDNCGIPTLSQTPPAGTEVSIGTTVITIEATDGLNISSCSFDLLVNNSLQLSITCPEDQTENASAACEFIVPDYRNQAIVSQVCGSSTLSQTPLPGSTISAGTHTVTITAEDNAEITQCSFILTVLDTVPPIIICPGDQNEAAAENCLFTIPDYTPLAVIEDSCGIESTTQSPAAGSQVGVGTTTITLTTTDGFNEVGCSFNIFVEDTEGPVIDCPESFSVNANNSSCSFLLPNYIINTEIIDNCNPNPVITQNPLPGSQLGLGENEITITANDGTNESVCTFIITVVDGTSPFISCPEDQISELTANCTFTLPDYTPMTVTEDNCSAVTVTQMPLPGTQIPLGITQVIFTASDGVNTNECAITLTVTDAQPPTVLCQNITLELDEDGLVTLDPTLLDAGSNDICGIASYEADSTVFDCNNVGENIVTFIVTDSNGNTATCTSTVTVNSNANPMAVCENVTAVLDENGMVTIDPLDVENGSTGGCVYSLDIDTFSCEDIGDPIMVTLTLGNPDDATTSICTALVNVVDNLQPVITCPSEMLTIAALAPYSIPDFVANQIITIEDNCASQITYNQIPEVNSLVEAGQTEVIITATDPSGNVSTCSFVILVDPTLGNENLELNSIYTLPNPAGDTITIFNPENIAINNITVYDITGRVVKTYNRFNNNDSTLDISDLSSATYFLKITSDTSHQVIQLIKK